MSDSLINGLIPQLTDAQVDDSTRVLPIANVTSGIANFGSIGQIKKVTSTQRIKYVATGAEGTTLSISALAGRYILGIWREGACLYDVLSAPDSAEYIWDSTNITLGLATNAGERFLILWKNI